MSADDEDFTKPRTHGFVTTSTGNRVRVDELDMAVLNIGHGSNPMSNAHFNNGRGNFLRPIYNVDFKPELRESPRTLGADPRSHEVFGDGNNPETIRQSTGLHQFDQVHAINPYAYDPVKTATNLLAPMGQLVVTGTARNEFALPSDVFKQVPATIETDSGRSKILVDKMTHKGTDLSDPISTAMGTMNPLHSQFPHQLTGGKQLPIDTSRSHTYQRIPQGFHNVTPPMDELTQLNTLANSRPQPLVESQSVRVSSTKPKKTVSFAPLPSKE